MIAGRSGLVPAYDEGSDSGGEEAPPPHKPLPNRPSLPSSPSPNGAVQHMVSCSLLFFFTHS